MNYIDIHTHRNTQQEGIDQIVSFDLLSAMKTMDSMEGTSFPFSLGLHPWSVDQVDQGQEEERWKFLKQGLSSPHCRGLGEIGLDRSRKASWNKQLSWFIQQVELAKSLRIPVIFFHCVRAYDEMMSVLKQTGYEGKLIFHDYNGNLPITERLLRLSSPVYFSYGSKLFQEQSQGHKVLKHLPLQRLFLETDDRKEMSIQTIYAKAMAVLGLSEEDLKRRIIQNYSDCFGHQK